MAARAACIGYTTQCRPSRGVSGLVRIPYFGAASIAGRKSRGGPGGRAGGTSALWYAERGRRYNSKSARRSYVDGREIREEGEVPF
jgi:hypothetical protein